MAKNQPLPMEPLMRPSPIQAHQLAHRTGQVIQDQRGVWVHPFGKPAVPSRQDSLTSDTTFESLTAYTPEEPDGWWEVQPPTLWYQRPWLR